MSTGAPHRHRATATVSSRLRLASRQQAARPSAGQRRSRQSWGIG
jgi:hypothetical protein